DMVNDLDFQILQIDQAPHPPTFIFNIYNQYTPCDPTTWTLDRLTQVLIPQGVLVIVTGDWNLHHPVWSANNNN
ncbi:hypothetical protein J3A83DRAFT_4062079, partial [Scleroderma citrinum]